MDEILTKLKKLYIDVPPPGYGTLGDLRNVYARYLPLLADVSGINGDHKTISELKDRAIDIDTLLSAVRSANTKKDAALFFKGAYHTLKADIKSLIEIIDKDEAI